MSHDTPRPNVTDRRLLVGGILLVLLYMLNFCGLLELLTSTISQELWWLVAWTSFIWRVLPEMNLNPSSVALAVAAALGCVAAARGCIAYALPRLPGGKAAHPWRWSWALVGGMALCFSGALAVVALAGEIYWIQHEGASLYLVENEYMSRLFSKFNLKDISNAVSCYHDAQATFPPGGTFDSSGRQLHGWMARLLPCMEQGPLSEQIDWQKSWRSPGNRPVYSTKLSVFLISRRHDIAQLTDDGYAATSYSGNASVFGREAPLAMRDIRDGLADTILAGEIISELPAWGDAANFRDPALGISRHPRGFGSPWKGGAYFVLCDGSIRHISNDVEPATLQKLSTPDAGDKPTDW